MKLVRQTERSFLDNNVSTDGKTILVDNIQPATSGGVITIGTKSIGKVTTAVATSDGLTTGLLTSTDQFVTVTSSSANNIITLPAVNTVPINTVISGTVGSNGFKLRVAVADASTVYLNGVTTSVKAAIPANVSFRVQLISATQWILTYLTALGAVGTAIVPA